MDKKRIAGNADWYTQLFNQFEKGLNGQTKKQLHQIRKNALKEFTEQGFPTTRDEEWKYTDIKPITRVNFDRTDGRDVTVTDIKKFMIDNLDSYLLVFLNGKYQPELSVRNKDNSEIIIESLRDHFEVNDNRLSEHFARYARSDSDSFTALNTAFTEDGALVYLAKNSVAEKPVHLLYLNEGSTLNITTPRNLIIAEENAKLQLIETYASLGDQAYFTNSVNEIVVVRNAQVEHFKIQQENESAYHISSTYVNQQRSSLYRSHNFVFGGHLVRNNFNTYLDDEGIECYLNGLYVGTNDQHIDNHTTIDHAKPNCHSEELYKGVLDDRAHGVFNGKIFVRPDAQKTNAIQSNNIILLSDNAAIDTKPQLEIFADDVRCTHGATIGQLDENAYFYLRSRGIDKTRARQLLIYAFASDVIDRVEIEPLRKVLSGLLAEKLHTIRPE